ncbi:MAG: ABC transporter substrate-binding protein, partial [Alphaproteobacteria bacterium]
MRAPLRSLLLALALSAAPTLATAGPAADLIGAMGDEARQMLRATEGDLGMRETALRAGLVNDFDMDYIARFALGDYWTRATADQQQDYLNMFGAYVVATYARRLGGYAGDELSIVDEEAAGPNDVLVSTHVTRGDAAPIEAEWRVRAAEDASPRV